ncbi:unnamed protein product [Microthlaspi erraticum]|uniref:DUF223 domain-containing protein n=1 Tax=Microthlaspi erraticum TaxID=1685480 RepID=A0A6D2KU93_9BRAS|nr:unnamed protein product [Microthlaspi erraticum]
MLNDVKLARVGPNRHDSRITVKVLKIWDTIHVDTGEGLSFLFLDDEERRCMHWWKEKISIGDLGDYFMKKSGRPYLVSKFVHLLLEFV